MADDASPVDEMAALPEAIRRYQEAHDRRETDRALAWSHRRARDRPLTDPLAWNLEAR